MNTFRVLFEDGDSLVTGMNATLEEAKTYYVGQGFELDEMKPLVRAVAVVQVDDDESEGV